jgi:hypothetical protein
MRGLKKERVLGATASAQYRGRTSRGRSDEFLQPGAGSSGDHNSGNAERSGDGNAPARHQHADPHSDQHA